MADGAGMKATLSKEDREKMLRLDDRLRFRSSLGYAHDYRHYAATPAGLIRIYGLDENICPAITGFYKKSGVRH
jgi:hypothetical protein